MTSGASKDTAIPNPSTNDGQRLIGCRIVGTDVVDRPIPRPLSAIPPSRATAATVMRIAATGTTYQRMETTPSRLPAESTLVECHHSPRLLPGRLPVRLG